MYSFVRDKDSGITLIEGEAKSRDCIEMNRLYFMNGEMRLSILKVIFMGLVLAQFLIPAVKGKDSTKVAHVFVALCDNTNQGIVPVPSFLGNGQDPGNNLYWGARYGVRTFFDNSTEWMLQAAIKNPSPSVLERCVFLAACGNAYLVADAYDGAQIKKAVTDFLMSVSGNRLDSVSVNDKVVGIGGNSDLVAYVGHNGLMDFRLDSLPAAANTIVRDAIILACASKAFFEDAIKRTGANPLLWTTNLMAPEAYTLRAAIDARFKGLDGEDVRTEAAEAYDQYQKCGLRAARRPLVTGSAR